MSTPSVQLNESVSRVIAFLVMILSIVFFFTHLLVIPLFLLFDFYLRGWEMQRYSILRWIALQVNHILLQNRQRPVFAAPKYFAAKLGAFFNFAVILTYVLGYDALTNVLVGAMTCFALLEAVFGFCAGTYIYNYYERLRHHQHS
jgi:hypothetical protein